MGSVKSTDRGYNALLKRVFGFGRPQIAMGILEADAQKEHEAPEGADAKEHVTVLDVGTWNEFGTDTVPARSFIRAWFDEASPAMRTALTALMKGVVAGTHTKEQILELLGQRGQGGIQKRIAQGIDPPNAPATVKAKGSSKPLINSGQLRQSVTYAVRESKGGGGEGA